VPPLIARKRLLIDGVFWVESLPGGCRVLRDDEAVETSRKCSRMSQLEFEMLLGYNNNGFDRITSRGDD
jgi:hypothetical protein